MSGRRCARFVACCALGLLVVSGSWKARVPAPDDAHAHISDQPAAFGII